MPPPSPASIAASTLAAHTSAIEQVIQIMHAHLHEPLSLDDLASAACLRPFHFNRVFRRLIGIPPGEFLSALRLQAARQLLLATSLSVTEICFEVGYSSIGSFTSRFTYMVGLPPRLLHQQASAFEPPSLTISLSSPQIKCLLRTLFLVRSAPRRPFRA